MKTAREILTSKITEVVDFDQGGNHAIRYWDAIAAIQEALCYVDEAYNKGVVAGKEIKENEMFEFVRVKR